MEAYLKIKHSRRTDPERCTSPASVIWGLRKNRLRRLGEGPEMDQIVVADRDGAQVSISSCVLPRSQDRSVDGPPHRHHEVSGRAAPIDL